MKVLFSGGGTMGSVTPLVAIYEELKARDPKLEVLWLGTKKGPEKEFLSKFNIPFKIVTSAKLRRYWSGWNLLAPFSFWIGVIHAYFILRKFRPDVILTAGSFVAVPVIFSGWLLHIPSFIHQQDLEIGLANKLMARWATVITVTFKESLNSFDRQKTKLTGNPVRQEVLAGTKDKALQFFQLKSALPTILITGGGTGAQIINQAVFEALGQLISKYQIIHLTGIGKSISQQLADFYPREILKLIKERYRPYEFLGQDKNSAMPLAMTLADLVISRAGFSTLSELAVLAKPAIIIPIPGHQEVNAQYFAKYNAIKILAQDKLTKQSFIEAIEYLMQRPGELNHLSQNISQLIDQGAAKKYAELIYRTLGIKN
jgi:UDP-N-acetylglucosamine--N-acetylmuramyl-(pentapeptide) pyrophosphoryl-undecaprenol N-acetylglucosamine transferase